jgi:hypothetical protein
VAFQGGNRIGQHVSYPRNPYPRQGSRLNRRRWDSLDFGQAIKKPPEETDSSGGKATRRGLGCGKTLFFSL